jgi:phytoene dehydrogenase-like protein
VAVDRYDVIVIGAGTNGLTAAARLAGDGRRVVVLERRAVLGGLAATEEFHPGFRAPGPLHDAGAVRPGVLEALGLAGDDLATSATPPPVFAPQTEGPGLLLAHAARDAAEEIRAHEPRDVEGYAAYRSFLARIEPVTRRFVDEPLPDPLSSRARDLGPMLGLGFALRRLGRDDMMEVLRIVPMCVADWLGEWFASPLLTALLAGPALDATFTGPWSPGSAAALLRADALGGCVVADGPGPLVAALERCVEERGVDVRTGSEVTEVVIEDGAVTGVRLKSGDVVHAPIVAASCDPRRALGAMLPRLALPARVERDVGAIRMRGTTAKVNLALSAPLRFACRPELAVTHARTGETVDDLERAFDAVKYGRASERPTLDIRVLSGPAWAPEGACVASIVVHFAPYALDGGWGDAARDALGGAVEAELARYAPDTSRAIVAREVLTPLDLERRYGVTEGHVHHGEHAIDQLVVRPCPRCTQYETPVRGLYLCGSGSHPGGGVTCGPGWLAAGAIGAR